MLRGSVVSYGEGAGKGFTFGEVWLGIGEGGEFESEREGKEGRRWGLELRREVGRKEGIAWRRGRCWGVMRWKEETG